MVELVSNAIVQETVSHILSGLVQKYEETEESKEKRNLERLEMAHIRLEAALDTSNKWQITDPSLLRWRRKLKRATEECDDTLHKCKKRILEDEQMEQKVKNSSLPNRIVHATKSFALSVFKRNDNELSGSIAQRFEWYADGASEFMRFIELGGTPRLHMAFDSLIKNLFAGKELHHKVIQGNDSFQLSLVPSITELFGVAAILIFIQSNGTPEGNIYFSITIQLSECTDIVGIAIRCLQFFAPHFRCTPQSFRNKFIQLLSQDLSWMPSAYSYQKEQLRLQILVSQWLRPNPLCCKQHVRHEVRHPSSLEMAGLSECFLEPVHEVILQVSLSASNKQETMLSEDIISLQDYPFQKAGIHFTPHRSSADMMPANRSPEIVEIIGKEQRCLLTSITLEQLKDILLPRAIEYFNQHTVATVYQVIWKSQHGTAYIQIEKASVRNRRTSMRKPRNFGGAKKGKLLQLQDQVLGSSARVTSHLLDLWGAHLPVQLRNTMKGCLQKEA